MKLALVGVTGLVGQTMVKVLEERKLPVERLIPVASHRSIGRNVSYNGRTWDIVGVQQAIDLNPDIAIFSAGSSASLEWAPVFAAKGTIVIDNSSAWRMKEGIPLIIPEINASILNTGDRIISNPNCSTIQMLMVLAPLHSKYIISRIVVSTYQSVTGTGVKAATQLSNEGRGNYKDMVYPHQIHLNCIPHCDVFEDNAYTREEMKLLNETRKILDSQRIQLTATAVRVPVIGGHSESVNVEFENDFELKELIGLINDFPGVVVQDRPEENLYPMPVTAYGKDEVFVGRIRRDHSREKSVNFWIVSDNIRKGAATNAVQIAEYILNKKLI